jgi:chorismate dehydratase
MPVATPRKKNRKKEPSVRLGGPELLRVAQIPFLNTVPFFLDWPREPFSLVQASPRQLGHLAAEGRLDAGPLPLVDYWKLEEDFEPLGNFGIAVKKEAGSVFLFSKRPIDQLAGATVGVTNQTSTSAQLLKILLLSRYGIEARFRPGFERDDEARLLIGDEALRVRFSDQRVFPHAYDLGREWREWRGLPFVFARWVVRRSVPAYLKASLVRQLHKSLALYNKRKSSVLPAAARRMGLPPKIVKKYLDGFVYKLGKSEQRAETAFRDLVTGKIPGCGC